MSAKHPPEWYARRASLGGLTRAAKLTAAERSAIASKAGKAAAEARARKRAERGEPEPKRKNGWETRAAPRPEDLKEFYAAALAADPEASELQLRRSAIALRSAWLARQAWDAQNLKDGDR